jgi:hypothetical protein
VRILCAPFMVALTPNTYLLCSQFFSPSKLLAATIAILARVPSCRCIPAYCRNQDHQNQRQQWLVYYHYITRTHPSRAAIITTIVILIPPQSTHTHTHIRAEILNTLMFASGEIRGTPSSVSPGHARQIMSLKLYMGLSTTIETWKRARCFNKKSRPPFFR